MWVILGIGSSICPPSLAIFKPKKITLELVALCVPRPAGPGGWRELVQDLFPR